MACHTKVLGDFTVHIKTNHFEVETSTDGLEIELSPCVDINKFKNQSAVVAGMAVDIGTTTVAAFFYDLETGKRLYTASDVNKQKAYGADVMSRIGYCTNEANGNETLHKAIISQLNEMIEEFCNHTGFRSECIADCVLTGNTTMLLLAAGMSITSLGHLPFEPQSLFGEYVKNKNIGLHLSEKADVYLMPAVSGFLGGDAIAVMLACDFDLTDKNTYMVDIGTNGEMALKHNGSIFACSTAAGPAFEGAQIHFGSGSINGAIRRVYEENNAIKMQVIGDVSPMSICGSGLLDAVALMKNNEIIDETGRIEDVATKFSENIFSENGEECFSLDKEKNVFITQKDIREVQLAKAAISAGSYMLTFSAGIKETDVEDIFVAGGFGSAINMDSAGQIGLLPKHFCEKASVIGNAAGTGAIMALLSIKNRERAEIISKTINVIELSGDPVFENEFVERMMFE